MKDKVVIGKSTEEHLPKIRKYCINKQIRYAMEINKIVIQGKEMIGMKNNDTHKDRLPIISERNSILQNNKKLTQFEARKFNRFHPEDDYLTKSSKRLNGKLKLKKSVKNIMELAKLKKKMIEITNNYYLTNKSVEDYLRSSTKGNIYDNM